MKQDAAIRHGKLYFSTRHEAGIRFLATKRTAGLLDIPFGTRQSACHETNFSTASLGLTMTKLHYHESVMGLLESLAKLDPMVGPTELVCMWYDDLYFPADKHPELFNPGVWERGQKEWRECFTERELEVLGRFHEVFDSVVENISEDPLTFGQDANWLRVSAAAQSALRELQL